MKCALMLLVFNILTHQSWATACSSSGLISPMVVSDTNEATQLAEAVNCSDGYFFVYWIGEVKLDGIIEVGANTTLEIAGAENGSSFIDGSGHTGLFQTTGGILHLHDLTLTNGTNDRGGAISAWHGSEVKITNCTFIGNNASRGGAIFGKETTVRLLGNTSFDTNRAGIEGGGIFGEILSVFFEGRTVVKGNEAGLRGGGVQAWSGGSYFEVSGIVFFERNKSSVGGGLVVGIGTEFMVFGKLVFDSNTAISIGGGMYSRGGGMTNFSTTSSVKFFNNTSLNGGAMGIENSYIYFDGDVIMESNFASSSGGAVYCDESEAVEINKAVFSSNFAEEMGGAIAMISVGSEHGVPTISNCVFEDNNARASGGAVYVTEEPIDVSTSTFTVNTAGQNGGAVAMVSTGSKENTSTIWSSSFKDNKATFSGGAVYVTGGVVDVVKSNFTANKAEDTGGAIAMVSTGATESASTIRNSSFEENEASDSGGAVYMVGGVVDVSNSSFPANKAEQAGGAIHTSGITSIDTCLFEENSAYIGTAVSTAITSETKLEAIQFGNNNLLCSTDFFLDGSNGSDYGTACYNCGNCANCSFANATQVQLCAAILDNTASPLSNGTLATLTLDKGYWRSSNRSKDIRECYEPSACVGGSDTYCKTGYSGPFCAVCTDGYARGLGYTCLECTKGRRSVATALAVAILVIALALVTYGLTLLRSGHDQKTCSSRQGLAGLQPRFGMARASQALKIVIVAWQIVTQFSSVASVTYPALYEMFLALIDVFNFNLGWIFAAGCIIDINFYTNLLVVTVGPLVILGLISMSYIFTVYKRRESDPAEYARGEYRHGSAVFWTSFLIYSSASSAIFRTFACDDLDNGKSYLRVDHSLECYTLKHAAFVGYASVMMVIYPIGIPVCYALVLYRSRNTLKMGQDRDEDTTISTVKDLWKPYRPKAYYYEVIECLRRATLSGIVVFVYPNTAGQVAVTFLLALFFSTVMMILDPYANIWDTWLARLGHGIVIISMFVALLLKVDLSGEEVLSQDVFAGVLIVGNCAMILAVVAEAVGTCFVTVRELRHPIAAENVVRQASTTIGILPSDSLRVVDMMGSPPTYDVYANDLPGSTGHCRFC